MTGIVTAWPVPTPFALFNNAASVYEANPALYGIDARSSFSVAATNCRLVANTAYDLYLYQGNLALELMPDSAQLWLSRHANIWGVPQRQPTPSTGNAIFSGQVNIPIPSGTLLTYPALGWTYLTTQASNTGTGGSVSVPVTSSLAGSQYNLPGGTPLQLLNPIYGIGATVPLDSNGTQNGTDLESNDSWRARILYKIRTPPDAGSGPDYIRWAQAAGAGSVNPVGGAIGAGSVGVYIAAPGPAIATSQLVAAVQAYIGVYGTVGGVRPITANVQVFAATALTQNVVIHLVNDSQQAEQIASQAAIAYINQVAAVGGTLYVGLLAAAISNALDNAPFDLVAPSADVVATLSQIILPGSVTFT